MGVLDYRREVYKTTSGYDFGGGNFQTQVGILDLYFKPGNEIGRPPPP